jgi:hypothetical protein
MGGWGASVESNWLVEGFKGFEGSWVEVIVGHITGSEQNRMALKLISHLFRLLKNAGVAKVEMAAFLVWQTS